ncbi:hypothetical protein K501DRAFT_187392 [Backusella circina FSU 941]|nr:hypothetical protein K501DRAFT_187392 [Backusella circina FSU 941]
MSPVIKEIATENAISSIVDLGAGQGYLSRTLAFKSGLKVLAVDSSTVQTCGAKRFDEIAAKHISKEDLDLHHVTEMITHENASTILSKWSDNVQDEKWLLCGLHTCGDLSTMMLRLFITSAEITSLVNIGCCYHFLTDNEDANAAGFPMSDMVRDAGFYLSPPGKMLSCQAPFRWSDKKTETLVAFEHHFFRALLQFIMVEKGLTTVSVAPVVGRLNKKKDFTSFPVYVKAALKRFKLTDDAISSEEAEEYYEKYKNKQIDKEITILWTLRVLLGPILESIILVDRWLYLHDTIPDSETKSVRMWPLFDPLLSPRNVIIAANK